MRSIAFVDIKEENELGRGSFGVVFKGIYKGQVVAVKKLLDSLNKTQLSTFASEADIMASIPKHSKVLITCDSHVKQNTWWNLSEW